VRVLDRYDTFALGVAELIASREGTTNTDDVEARVQEVLAVVPGLDPTLHAAAVERVPAIVADLRTVGLLWGLDDSLNLVRAAREGLSGTLESEPDDVLERAHRHLAHVRVPDVLDAPMRDVALVGRAGAQAALDIVRLVTDLLDRWSTSPPPVLRSGGLGVRDLARAAEELDVDTSTAAFVIELAAAAALLADDGAADAAYAPTVEYDVWLDAPVAERWATLALAWFTTPRAAGLVGTRDAKDVRLAALGPELERSLAVTIRRAVLTELADLPDGLAAPEHDVLARVNWRRPRRATVLRRDLVGWTLHEAATLGVTGMGALTTPGRALLDAGAGTDGPTDIAALADVLEPLLPPAVDHVILQPDMTAVAPGPLTPEVARELALLADIESTGGATVYRFSDATIRRAFDAGRDAPSIKTFLTEHSRTPVPQPLTYMIDDVARRHGSLRLGAASTYLRCDDPETLSTLMADRTSTTLHLRRIAPTVVISPVSANVVLERLQSIGLAPALESGDGVVVLRSAQPRRANAGHASSPAVLLDAPPAQRLLDVAVRALRHGEAAGPEARPSAPVATGRPLPPRSTPSKTLAVIRAAIEDGGAVRIGYAGSDGTTGERLLDPVHVVAGQLTAYDHHGGDVRTFAVSRITGVEILTDRSTHDLAHKENQ
jgi:hypothetical protein